MEFRFLGVHPSVFDFRHQHGTMHTLRDYAAHRIVSGVDDHGGTIHMVKFKKKSNKIYFSLGFISMVDFVSI